MIQSYAYDIIKQEGLDEGMLEGMLIEMKKGVQQGELNHARKAIQDILLARFSEVPCAIVKRIETIESLSVLDRLLFKTVTVKDFDAFETAMKKLLDAQD